MIVASQKAGTLMDEHDRKETEKDAPREESQTLKALREFQEKRDRELETQRKRRLDS